MKFYLATGLNSASNFIEQLETLGHQCTYNWTKNIVDIRASTTQLKAIANIELLAIKDADLFIFLPTKGRGSHVELGYALALNKPIVVFNYYEIEKIPFYMICANHVDTFEQLVNYINSTYE